MVNQLYIKEKNESALRANYCKYHLCKNYDEMIEIIKDKRPEYYEAAIEASNSNLFYSCNMFIMKTPDFINYSEFMFDILFEFDKRHNFSSDTDVLEYTKSLYNETIPRYYQSRLQGFLSERISTIFFSQYFKRIKTYDIQLEN
jgi:hypothetical protein